jgi:hypothetical protein
MSSCRKRKKKDQQEWTIIVYIYVATSPLWILGCETSLVVDWEIAQDLFFSSILEGDTHVQNQ